MKGKLFVPKGMSKDSIGLVAKLLNRNSQLRLGSGPRDAEEIKEHPFFADIDWAKLERREYQLPLPEFEEVPLDPQQAEEFANDEKRFASRRKELKDKNRPYRIVDNKHPKVAEQLKNFPQLEETDD